MFDRPDRKMYPFSNCRIWDRKARYSPEVRTILNQLGERLHTNRRVSNSRFRQCPKLLALTRRDQAMQEMTPACIPFEQLNLP